jgi:hypothetical protein
VEELLVVRDGELVVVETVLVAAKQASYVFAIEVIAKVSSSCSS